MNRRTRVRITRMDTTERRAVITGGRKRGWLSEQFHTGARNAVRHTIRKAREVLARNGPARRLAKRLETNLGTR